MSLFTIALLTIYLASISYITLFCLMQFHLLYHYKKFHRKALPEPTPLTSEELAHVTVQLTVFNEMYVVGRLIDNICALDYPREQVQIQLLDEPTDETHAIRRRKGKEYSDKGFDIQLIRRPGREG